MDAVDRVVTGAFPRTGVIPCGTGHGGDQRRQAAHAAAVAVEERGVEAERGEAAAMNGAGAEIRLGMGAVDGAAALPQAARRFSAVV